MKGAMSFECGSARDESRLQSIDIIYLICY